VIKYTAEEKAALVAFLKTLTDTTLIKDVRWSNPFCDRTAGSSLNPVLSLLLYPNPLLSGNVAKLNLMAGQEFSGYISLFSTVGQLVYQSKHVFLIGANILSLPSEQLPSGMYIINITSSDRRSLGNKKLIIVK
jgi:hypothetical protein